MEEELKEVFGDLKRPKSLILSAKQVIDAIHMAGGLALLAHPNFTFKKKSQTETWLIINTLKELGLDGYVSDIKDENGVKVFQDLNSTQSMVRVAGSDFHNLVSNLHLGTLLNSSESVKFSKNILSERDYNILTDTLKSNYNYRNKRRKFHIDQNLILRATAIMGEQNEVYGDNVNMMHDKLNNFTKNDYYTEIRQYAWHSIKQTWEDFNKYFVLDENAVKPEYNRKRMLSNMNRHFLKYMNARLADIDTIYFLPELFHTKVMPNYDPYKDIPDWTPDTVIDPKNKQKVVKILDGVKKSYNELHS